MTEDSISQPDFPEPHHKPQPTFNVSVAILFSIIVGLFISGELYLIFEQHDISRIRSLFIQDSIDRIASVENSLVNSVTRLESVASFYSGSGVVLREEFRRFTGHILSENQGVYALGWAPVLPNDERKALTEYAHSEGINDFEIFETDLKSGVKVRRSEQDFYYPVYFVEPYDRLSPLVGMDLRANESIGRVMDAARDTGQLKSTTVLNVRNLIGLFIPLYRGSEPEKTVEWRREQIAGHVFALISPSDLLDFGLNYLAPKRIRVEIVESGPKSKPVYQYLPGFYKRALSAKDLKPSETYVYRESRYMGSRRYEIICNSLPGYHQEHRSMLSRLAFGSGVIITFLVSFLLYRFLSFARRVRSEVARRTNELEDSKNRLEKESRKLQQSRRILEKVNRELDAFVYTASHDLRAPLRGISSFAQFLSEDHAGKLDNEEKEYIDEIRKSASRMDQLISDLLILSRVSRIKNPYSLTKLEDLVDEILERFAFDLKQNNVKLQVKRPMAEVVCDPIKIKEVFANLIGNAIKFSSKIKDRQPEITVWSENSEKYAEIFIKDNGVGIDPKHHEKIFDIFTRLHDEGEFEGTGAGLSIVKRIVDDHKGKISVQSASGKGSVFIVRLPHKKRTAKA